MEQLELDNNLNAVDRFNGRYYREITVNGSQQQNSLKLLEILNQYSRNNQSAWITCILPEKIDRLVLDKEGIPAAGVLQLINKVNSEIQTLAIKALQSGKSHGVIVMSKRMSTAQRNTLSATANSGGVYCTVIDSY